MAIPTYDFPSHYKGDTFISRVISFSSVTNNTPIDLTDAVINIQFKENANTPTAYFWSTSDNSIILTDPINGLITMTEKIIDVTPSTYFYDIQVVNNLGVVKTYFKGSQQIIQDLTS